MLGNSSKLANPGIGWNPKRRHAKNRGLWSNILQNPQKQELVQESVEYYRLIAER